MMLSTIRRILFQSVILSALFSPSLLAADITLLNASYDPTRELYREYNQAFARYYQAKTGNKVKIEQSHGGVHDGEHELPGAPKEIYTWQSDRQPIALIKKTAYMLEQVLLEEGLKQDAEAGNPFAKDLVGKLGHSVGRLLHGSLYMPPTLDELQDDADITEGPVVCNACSR